MSIDRVLAYYQGRGEAEVHRLDNPYEGMVEAEIHRRVFTELVPGGARVLDLGGGPGHWTAWLLRRGHRVVLADLSPRMLELARRDLDAAGLTADAVVECDARDLSRFAAGEFDVVLALGPFYHLLDAADRDRALAELARVLRPGGLLLATVMMRVSWLVTAALSGAIEPQAMARLLEDGVYRSPVPGPLTEAYLFRAEEVAPFFAAGGFATARLVASQGPLNQVQEQLATLREEDPARFEALLDAAYGCATDPSLLGLSGHVLYAGTRVREGVAPGRGQALLG